MMGGRIYSYQGDARVFDSIDEYNYFYFYNPFIGDVMSSVIEQLEKSIVRNTRRIIVIYHNPFAKELFINSGLFQDIKSFFLPSIINFNKDNYKWINGRQYIDIYCTEPLDINFKKKGIVSLS